MHGQFPVRRRWGDGILPLRTRQSGHPDRIGSGCEQSPRTSPGSRPGGVDVVNQENPGPLNDLRPGHKKSATNIFAALTRAQARLTGSAALSLKNSCGKGKVPGSTLTPDRVYGSGGETLGVIESSLMALACVERHGNHDHAVWRLSRERQDGVRQASSQCASNGLHAIVFQPVNQGAQRALIRAIRHRSPEIGPSPAAKIARRFEIVCGFRFAEAGHT